MVKRFNEANISFMHSNMDSLNTDQVCVKALVQGVKPCESSDKGFPYVKVSFQCLDNRVVRIKSPTKTDQNGSKRIKTDQNEDRKFNLANETVFIKEMDTLRGVGCFDNDNGKKLEIGMIVKFFLSADKYMDRTTFKIHRVILGEEKIDETTFNNKFKNSVLCAIPTKQNITVLPGEDSKWASRPFLLPLSQDSNLYSEVDILVNEHNGFYHENQNRNRHVSITTDVNGGHARNAMGVMYTIENSKKCFVKFSYLPEVWDCFGVSNIDIWSKVAVRLFGSAKAWYAYGYSKLDEITSMVGNAGGCDYSDNIEPTSGFICKMFIDLPGTVRNASVRLSHDWVNQFMGAMGSYQFITDDNAPPYPWRANLKKPGVKVINVSEINDDSRPGFFREVLNKENVSFHGVFSFDNDAPYEQFDHLQTYMEENKHYPAAVFAIVTE